MNRARLRELGFELGARADAGESDEGAWFATAPDGTPVVLKWFPDETVAGRYALLLPGLDDGAHDIAAQASAAWEAAVCWDDEYAVKRLADVRAV